MKFQMLFKAYSPSDSFSSAFTENVSLINAPSGTPVPPFRCAQGALKSGWFLLSAPLRAPGGYIQWYFTKEYEAA